MRRLVAALAAVLALSACGTAASTPSPGALPADRPAASAYVDVTLDREPLARIAEESGLRDFVLSFALSDGGACRPSWGGVLPVDDPALAAEIADVRAAGGSVTVASGGASGDYLENVCTDPASLAAAYGSALDATGSDHLEVDIEQGVPTDTVVRALARLQEERGTAVTLTLPVAGAEQGLTDDALAVVRAAAAAGVDAGVNGMVMNFPDPGNWAAALTASGDRVAAQLTEVHPGLDDAGARRLLALTFMAGRNDTGPVTTLADATALARYAADGRAARLAFWSIGRDNGGCPDGTLSPTCSGIAQDRYAFARAVAEAG